MDLLEILLLLLLVAALAAAWWFRRRLGRSEQRQARELAELRARHDAELRAHRERTAALFDRMVEGVIIVGPTGEIRLANRAAAALFEFSAPMAGRTILEATRRHEVADLVSQLAEKPEVLDHELRLERRARRA